jgi:hypothetical protein
MYVVVRVVVAMVGGAWLLCNDGNRRHDFKIFILFFKKIYFSAATGERKRKREGEL